jgi:hypothetical protein
MMNLPGQPETTTEYAVEGNGWVVVERLMPCLKGQPARALLALSAGLPGAFRYVRKQTPAGDLVRLLGEIPSDPGAVRVDGRVLDEWLRRAGDESSASSLPAEDAVEDILNEGNLTSSRRGASWAIAPLPGFARELGVELVPGGVRIEAILASWDEINPDSAHALEEFLLTSQSILKCARCELGSHRACVVSPIRTEDLRLQLMHGLLGVAAATRLLAREASALLAPEIAQVYLELMTIPATRPGDVRSG